MAFALLLSLLFARGYAVSWGYDEAGHNISDWIHLYPECGYSRQSPIDITINNETSECQTPLVLEWESQIEHFAIRNNGHSLQVIPFEITHQGGSDLSGLEVSHHKNDTNIRLKNGFFNTYRSHIHSEYCFDSLHFHWGLNNDSGSEHTINGKHYPLEVHLVHYSCDYYMSGNALTAYSDDTASENYDDDNVLAVIGVLFEIGEANPVLDQILSDVIIDGVRQYHDPADVHDNKLELYYSEFDIMDLLPSNKEIVAYLGSLTTPPCYETVRWHVMKDTMTVSEQQMEKFRSMLESTNSTDSMAPNFRPVQDIGDRVIYQCQETVDAETVEKDELIVNEINNGDETAMSEKEDITWFIIGIVFICLFAVTMVVIGYLYYNIYHKKSNDDPKASNGERAITYKSVKSVDIEEDPLPNTIDYH